MRTFIAIELPQEIKATLGKLQEELKKTGADVKWVAPENIHLTLKFLGERDDKKISKIKEILDEVALGNKQFPIQLSNVGAFPRINSPRIIWIGVAQGDTETKKIAKELEEKIAKIGIPKEDRVFSSHITLGRTRSGLNQDTLSKALDNSSGFKIEGEFNVAKITLFKSILTPKGPLYEILKVASLQAT